MKKIFLSFIILGSVANAYHTYTEREKCFSHVIQPALNIVENSANFAFASSVIGQSGEHLNASFKQQLTADGKYIIKAFTIEDLKNKKQNKVFFNLVPDMEKSNLLNCKIDTKNDLSLVTLSFSGRTPHSDFLQGGKKIKTTFTISLNNKKEVIGLSSKIEEKNGLFYKKISESVAIK